MSMSQQQTHGMIYYLKCMFAGMLSCGVTHTLGYVDNRRSIFKKAFKDKIISQIYGVHEWKSVSIGYLFYGLGKLGFYEFIKDLYISKKGQETHNSIRGWIISAAVAETVSALFIWPWKKKYYKMYSPIPGFGGTVIDYGFLLFRQIPFTIAYFTCYQYIKQLLTNKILNETKANQSKKILLGISFASGCFGGMFSIIISHPPDVLISNAVKITYKAGSEFRSYSISKRIMIAYSEIGFLGMWRGAGVRLAKVGTLAGLQWGIYDTIKLLIDSQTTGANKQIQLY